MQYAFLLYADETKYFDVDAQTRARIDAAYLAYTNALQAADKLRAGEPLERASMSRRVRVRNGERHVENGPFLDAKEQLGGFYVVEAKDLDEALDLAARCPAASDGRVEVRPEWAIN